MTIHKNQMRQLERKTSRNPTFLTLQGVPAQPRANTDSPLDEPVLPADRCVPSLPGQPGVSRKIDVKRERKRAMNPGRKRAWHQRHADPNLPIYRKRPKLV